MAHIHRSLFTKLKVYLRALLLLREICIRFENTWPPLRPCHLRFVQFSVACLWPSTTRDQDRRPCCCWRHTSRSLGPPEVVSGVSLCDLPNPKSTRTNRRTFAATSRYGCGGGSSVRRTRSITAMKESGSNGAYAMLIERLFECTLDTINLRSC